MNRTLWVTQHEIETILYDVALPKDAKVSITLLLLQAVSDFYKKTLPM